MLEPRLVNARTAARVLGVSVYTVRRLARAGALPARRFRPGGDLRFRVGDLDEFDCGCPRGADEAAPPR